MVLGPQYFWFSSLMGTPVSQTVSRRVSKPQTVVHVRGMNFPNLIHPLVMHMLMVITNVRRTRDCNRLNSSEISVACIPRYHTLLKIVIILWIVTECTKIEINVRWACRSINPGNRFPMLSHAKCFSNIFSTGL